MASQVELEISAQRAMDHVNVVKCWNVEADDSHIYLIMDYCPNGDLFQRVRQSQGRRLPEREVFRLFIQLVAGVNHIHSLGFAHRDLKLENLLMDAQDNLKIADFGWVARVNGYQKNRNFCGTLDYLAPEMVTGAGHDWRIDNWAIGVLLYELSRGKPPFISTAHYDLIRRILDVDIHDDDHGIDNRALETLAEGCSEQACANQSCAVLKNLIHRRRLPGIAPDCLDVVRHFLKKDPNLRAGLNDILNFPWIQRMLRTEYSIYLRRVMSVGALERADIRSEGAETADHQSLENVSISPYREERSTSGTIDMQDFVVELDSTEGSVKIPISPVALPEPLEWRSLSQAHMPKESNPQPMLSTPSGRSVSSIFPDKESLQTCIGTLSPKGATCVQRTVSSTGNRGASKVTPQRRFTTVTKDKEGCELIAVGSGYKRKINGDFSPLWLFPVPPESKAATNLKPLFQ